MAKIDTKQIAGYDEMTPEEKVKALEAFKLPEPDYSGYVKKEVFDKTASEVADWKKKYKDQLSQEDAAKQDREERFAQMEQELEALRKEKTVSEYAARFIAQGYDESLAQETAQALSDGDTEKVFANQQRFLIEYAKKLNADALKSTPTPPAGVGAPAMTLKKLKSLSDEEYNRFAAEHPDEYKALYEKGE